MSAPITPRIRPIPVEECSDEIQTLLTGELGAGAPVVAPSLADLGLMRTLARHERPFKSFLLLGRRLVLHAAIPFADRELLILRTAWNCGAAYEWGQHVRVATTGGVDRAVIDRVPDGPDAPGWDEHEAALLRAADELHATARLSDPTWNELRRRFDERQLIELPMLVGFYHLVAFTLGALAIVPEPGDEPLPRDTESPGGLRP